MQGDHLREEGTCRAAPQHSFTHAYLWPCCTIMASAASQGSYASSQSIKPHGISHGTLGTPMEEPQAGAARSPWKIGAEPVWRPGMEASESRQGGTRPEVGLLERQRPLGLGEALGLRLEPGAPRRGLSLELTWQARGSRLFRPTGALAASTGGQSLQALWERRTIRVDSQRQKERGRGTAQSPQ